MKDFYCFKGGKKWQGGWGGGGGEEKKDFIEVPLSPLMEFENYLHMN